MGRRRVGAQDPRNLREFASRHGDVLDALVDRDSSGRSQRTGSVTFGDADQARSAVDDLDGQDLDGSKIRASLTKEDASGGGLGGSVGGSIGGYEGSVGGSIG
ncbi:RNA recognition motif domain-containing protein [Streptomyces rubiginosohelvolus]|uniref:RNA recognition motif domain-containing protein n=1 Tax=Streptomyces rubiginosohelvolus TaxID=67362 RepID=UPI0036A29E3F